MFGFLDSPLYFTIELHANYMSSLKNAECEARGKHRGSRISYTVTEMPGPRNDRTLSEEILRPTGRTYEAVGGISANELVEDTVEFECRISPRNAVGLSSGIVGKRFAKRIMTHHREYLARHLIYVPKIDFECVVHHL